jgi:hypothetical protein
MNNFIQNAMCNSMFLLFMKYAFGEVETKNGTHIIRFLFFFSSTAPYTEGP